MVYIRRSIALYIMLISGLSYSAEAGEFGNIFGDKIEQASRQASAGALAGLEKIFSALQARELKNYGASRESLASAGTKLLDAAKEMRAISIPIEEDREIKLSDAKDKDKDILRKLFGLKEGDPIGDTKLSYLYAAFINKTEQIGAIVIESSKIGDSQAVYPRISELLSDYMLFGDVVSRLSKSS